MSVAILMMKNTIGILLFHALAGLLTYELASVLAVQISSSLELTASIPMSVSKPFFRQVLLVSVALQTVFGFGITVIISMKQQQPKDAVVTTVVSKQ